MTTLEEMADRAKAGEIVSRINGTMAYFPLCCSTGVLKGLTAQPATSPFKPNIAMSADDIKAAKSIHQLIRQLQKDNNTYIAPVEWAAWYALSLIHLKMTKGTDDEAQDGYSNYKTGQIVWADRINAEKRTGARFNSYNTTFACDSLTEWLEKQDKRKFGQVLASKPSMGAHGARVRACIYTPNVKFLGEWLKKRLAEVKEELLRQKESGGGLTWHVK
jgi:hypothetical protein